MTKDWEPLISVKEKRPTSRKQNSQRVRIRDYAGNGRHLQCTSKSGGIVLLCYFFSGKLSGYFFYKN